AALRCFEDIADSARFYFNIGIIYATMGEHEAACESYKEAVKLDQYFAVAQFQMGVSYFLMGKFESALIGFNDAFLVIIYDSLAVKWGDQWKLNLRGNSLIDYEQLGLRFRLYSCEILFNRGLCYFNLGKIEEGMADFTYAAKERQTEEHNVIGEAAKINGQGYTVFSLPSGIIYRPSEDKLKTKDILGKAKVNASEFSAAQKAKRAANQQAQTVIFNGRTVSPSFPISQRISLSTNPRSPPPFPIASQSASLSRQNTLNSQNTISRQNTLSSLNALSRQTTLNSRNTLAGQNIPTAQNGLSMSLLNTDLKRDNYTSGSILISYNGFADSNTLSDRSISPTAPPNSNVNSMSSITDYSFSGGNEDDDEAMSSSLPSITRQAPKKTFVSNLLGIGLQRSFSLSGVKSIRQRNPASEDGLNSPSSISSPIPSPPNVPILQRPPSLRKQTSLPSISSNTPAVQGFTVYPRKGQITPPPEPGYNSKNGTSGSAQNDNSKANGGQPSRSMSVRRGQPPFPIRGTLRERSNTDSREVSPIPISPLSPNGVTIPIRRNTKARAQYLQKQLGGGNIDSQHGGYSSDEAYASPPEDWNNIYDYVMNEDSPKDYDPRADVDRVIHKTSKSGKSNLLKMPTSPYPTSPSYLSPQTASSEKPYADVIFSSTMPGRGGNTQNKNNDNYSTGAREDDKIRIRVHYKDTRALLIPATIAFPELIRRIQDKFQITNSINLQYKDEDDELVTMIDQEDLEMALPYADSGRMDLWVHDE
ncbi:356_t:CDS:2, partial [Paraglomus occultum]